ncbi:MAG TPA: flavin reductase family protein [Syntrophales bacterium]|nr:flavin reductase family protein [Syntrophales bacterium]
MKKSIGAKTIVYPTPVFIVGTYDRDGRPNAMSAAWAGICCSSPPCVSIALRKATYTYGNIVEQKAFTVSIPSQDFVREADYFGIATGRTEDKFFAAGLTPEKSELVNAPYVKEFPLSLECKLLHTLEIGLHTLFIGEILDVKMEENVLGDDGLPQIEKIKPLIFSPSNPSYYGIGEYLGKAFSLGKAIRPR